MTRKELACLIDHTQVRAYATELDLASLCDEARAHRFACVTINPAWVSYCSKRLSNSGIGVNATIGFPLGADTAHMKVEETKEAIGNGATELDMMVNIGALKSGYPEFVGKEIAAVIKAAGGAPVKVILETGYLTDREKVTMCELARSAGAAFVKTSTGFGAIGVTVSEVKLLSRLVEDDLEVKAAGGIRSYHFAVALVKAGATRLGTSSSLKILAEAPED